MADPDRTDRAARAAREHVELRWDDARVEALLSRTKARGRRRTVYRVGLAAAAVIALAVGLSALAPGEARAPLARGPRRRTRTIGSCISRTDPP